MVVVVEGMAGSDNNIELAINHLVGDVVVVLAARFVGNIRSRGGVRIGNAGNNACGLSHLLGTFGEVLYRRLKISIPITPRRVLCPVAIAVPAAAESVGLPVAPSVEDQLTNVLYVPNAG